MSGELPHIRCSSRQQDQKGTSHLHHSQQQRLSEVGSCPSAEGKKIEKAKNWIRLPKKLRGWCCFTTLQTCFRCRSWSLTLGRQTPVALPTGSTSGLLSFVADFPLPRNSLAVCSKWHACLAWWLTDSSNKAGTPDENAWRCRLHPRFLYTLPALHSFTV